ncbi:flagellar hook-length control protein FliK [Tepidibacter formicigenes]|uniref:Hook-length control protein FliK n=1 Tax=Tepidibacter formicigenes DSM 15518 TaxID=1123349 RepID=A0A1M6J9E5_9FIRM|nr:flagellar hook-length control protein FliK [Tepidibacter formicigenes]SHJ43270.1 hook-length control protein FliK [Tepidibacter formicigenes DSM 15518]
MNNLLPINFNLQSSFSVKREKFLKTQNADSFKKAIDKFSKNDSNDKIRNKNKKNKNISNKKEYEKDRNIENQENIKNKDYNQGENETKVEEHDVVDEVKVSKRMKKEEQTLDVELKEDYNKDELIKKLESIIVFLQDIDLEGINNQNEVNKVKEILTKIYNDISNNNLNNEEIEKLFVKLEEADFIPEDIKNKILNDIKRINDGKIAGNISLNKNDINNDNNLDTHKKNIIEIKEDRINQENIEIEFSKVQKVNKNSSLEENLNLDFTQYEDEDLQKLEKEFFGMNEMNENGSSINLQNFNVLKSSQGIKNISSSLNLKQVSNINPNDILEQITKKSKLIIDKDNSSMEIKLEPEHLGKLTLKVVLERGILSAKFIAENDDVKSVIENNMEELKNNLLEQGLNIQSLSVSVDSQGDLSRHKNILEAMAYNKKNSKNININDVIEEEKENPYLSIDDNFNGLA